MPRKQIQNFVLACLLTLPLSTSRSESVIAATHPTHGAPLASVPGPHREVFGFGLAGSLSDPTVGYPSWDFNLLSTVAFFGLHVQTDGTFAADSGATVWNSSQLTGLVGTAHPHGTKVVLTVILQDFSANTPSMCAGLQHSSTTIANAVAEMRSKGVDGINLDYEGLNGSCGTGDSSWARHAFTNFAASLRAAMPAGSYLTVDTYASSASDSLGFFDVGGLAPSVDAFFVMAYDLEYSNWSHPPLNCASFCLSPTAPLNGYYYNDTSTTNQYVSVVAASKVILGVPYYGRKSCVASASPNQVPTSGVAADSYLDATGESTAPQTQSGSYATHRDANDPAGQERWDTWVNTSLNCTRELYWDDATSLGYKYDLAVSANLRGVGIWTLNYGGGSPELWNALDLRFGSVTSWTALGGGIIGNPAVTTVGASRFDAFVRGSGDGGVWHRWWTGTAWSGWESLGGVATSDPAAVSWGPNRIDYFVRGTDGAVWHRSWNGTAWNPWESLGGVIAGNPAAVSWGQNRLDVFVRGTDNALWHRASDGSTWGNWESLGGGLTASPNVSSGAANHLDVFVRGTDRGLWQRTWNGTAWVAWKSIGGVVPSSPVSVSAGTGRIDLFVKGTADNGLWQATWNGTAWNWTSLGGVLTSDPGATSCGAGHLDVFVTGTDGGIWHRGYNGSGWAAWQRLGGLWSGNPASVCPAALTNSIELFERDFNGALWQTGLTAS